ncbi:MAG: PAS domain S-box protein, partial [Blastocatellia bacterium]
MEERLGDLVYETVEDQTALHLTRTLEKSLEQILGPALIYDPRSLNIIAANNAAAEMYLCSKKELAGKRLREFFTPGELEKLHLLTSDPSFEFSGSRVWSHLTNNGEPVFVEMQSNSLTVGQRTLRAVILREVTDRRMLEEFARDLTRILE